MMHSPGTSKLAWMGITLVTLLSGATAGCVKRTDFQGETVVRVGEAPPAPAPPPAEKPPERVVVSGDHIEIHDKVQFETNRADIRADSSGLVDEIADVIKKNPQIKKLEVQGHASADGHAAANKRLSAARAKAVVTALLQRGVAKGVLVPKGYGQDRPVASNDTNEGREQNRRVEFVILDPTKPAAGGAK
jgi:outer membrane protein OmpA-like peptidoglycan-associated protein